MKSMADRLCGYEWDNKRNDVCICNLRRAYKIRADNTLLEIAAIISCWSFLLKLIKTKPDLCNKSPKYIFVFRLKFWVFFFLLSFSFLVFWLESQSHQNLNIYIYIPNIYQLLFGGKKKAQNKTLGFLHFDSLQMMSGNAFTIPSSLGGFVHQEQNPNPNPKLNQAASKKKRNLPGTPGN